MAENRISQRAKANFPTVLLTLLSIVQALALELMWSHLTEQPYLYTYSYIAVLSWVQIGATLLGILLIWLIYSSLVMRFSWRPTTTDAIFPFLIGIIEFAQIGMLGPGKFGQWFVMLGVLFGAMSWISQATMKRARKDHDNDDFFRKIAPATTRDNLLSLLPPVVLILIGAGLWTSAQQGWIALCAIGLVVAMLGFQIWRNHVYMQRSYEDE